MKFIDRGTKWLALAVGGVIFMAVLSQADLFQAAPMSKDSDNSQQPVSPGPSQEESNSPQTTVPGQTGDPSEPGSPLKGETFKRTENVPVLRR